MPTKFNQNKGLGLPGSSFGKGTARCATLLLAASLLLTSSPVALHAEVTLHDLAAEIAALRAENRQMKAEMSKMRGETHRTREKVEKVEKVQVREVRQGPYVPPPVADLPPGAFPVFTTAEKKLYLGGIVVTPGGFLAGESVFRSRTTQSDINSAWNNIPTNTQAGQTNEFRMTGRQSRLSLLAEGKINPAITASGYAEFDFLGAGTTSNETDTNSYAPRIRQLYAAIDWNDIGLHAVGGQMWSLTTINSRGITLRNEVPPPLIDGQFLPGFIFARQAGARLTKDFGNGLWAAIAAEEADTTFAGSASACANNGTLVSAGGAATPVTAVGALSVICSTAGTGAGFSQYGQQYSFNHLPDIIGKIAYEGHFADRDFHLEGMGLYKDLYNASYLTAATGNVQQHDVGGYGFGGGLIISIIPKRLDFQGSAMAGRGIGRYGAGLLADATLNVDGSLRPIGEIMGSGGFTFHATPDLDVYAFGGIEKQNRAFSEVGGTYVGYGIPNLNNSGCNFIGGTCAGQTQTLWELTAGFWDKVYSGPYGQVRVGLQYAYTQRDFFSTQTTPTSPGYSPKFGENTFMTSLRYYPFQ